LISIIKNEFIKSKKISPLLMVNILIVVSVALMYFTVSKLGASFFLNEKQLMDMFVSSTLKLMPFFIVILILKTITDEFTNGGMKIYLINPITRNELLIGKLLFIIINLILTIIIQMIIGIVIISVMLQVPTLDLISDTRYKYLITLIPIIGLTAILFIPGVLLNSSRNVISIGFAIIVVIPIVTTIYTKLYNYSIFKVIDVIGDSKEHLFMNISISIAYLLIGLILSSCIFYNKEIR
jgi:ABC-2 type transport system permease protein